MGLRLGHRRGQSTGSPPGGRGPHGGRGRGNHQGDSLPLRQQEAAQHPARRAHHGDRGAQRPQAPHRAGPQPAHGHRKVRRLPRRPDAAHGDPLRAHHPQHEHVGSPALLLLPRRAQLLRARAPEGPSVHVRHLPREVRSPGLPGDHGHGLRLGHPGCARRRAGAHGAPGPLGHQGRKGSPDGGLPEAQPGALQR